MKAFEFVPVKINPAFEQLTIAKLRKLMDTLGKKHQGMGRRQLINALNILTGV